MTDPWQWGERAMVALSDHETVVTSVDTGMGEPQQLLLLVHSALLDHRMYRDLASELRRQLAGSGAGWRIAAYDLRGHGAAAAAPSLTSIAQLVSDLAEVQQALGAEDAHLLGLSLGGAVVQQAALDGSRHVHSVTAMCTASRFPQDVMLERAELGAGGVADEVDNTIGRWFGEETPTDLSDQIRYVRARLAKTSPETWRGCWRSLAHFDVRDRLHELRPPLLAIAGEHDTAAPPTVVADIADSARGTYRCIDGAAHLAALDSPSQAAKLVASFLLRSMRLTTRPDHI